jgi:hypothetical protein
MFTRGCDQALFFAFGWFSSSSMCIILEGDFWRLASQVLVCKFGLFVISHGVLIV